MKPKIGQKVYLIYGNGILVDKVGYLGKYSFIIDSFSKRLYRERFLGMGLS